MTLFRTVEPAVEPVTLAEVKVNLRIDQNSDDDLLSSLIAAARGEVEARTGIALITQSWRLCLDDLPDDGGVKLFRYPVRAITAVTAYDADGAAQVIDPAGWFLDPNSRPSRLYVSGPLPALRRLNGLEIDFDAGFGEAGTDVPDSLLRAIHLLVARWYELRAAFGADSQPAMIPDGFDRLISSFEVPRI
jgi:uncharacterized phiE125 gp8 family phage protein